MIRDILLLQKIRRDPLAHFAALGESTNHAWFSILGSPVLFLNDATAIEYVFAVNDKNYHKGKYNEGLRPLLGNGLFMSEDALWRRQRRDAAPVFAAGNFNDFAARIAEAVEAMLARWKDGSVVDIHTETMRLTLDVVLRALFHEESEAALLNAKQALGTMLRLAERRIWSLVNLPMSLTLKRPRYARTLKLLDALTQGFIDARKENGAYPEDLLSRLIETHADTPKDRKLLRDNVLSFMLAGHETTANGLAWTFYELAQNDDAREKVLAEISTVGDTPDMDDVKKLAYTRQAFCEALRLYPPVWTMSRKALADDVIPLEEGTVRVPKNATVMLCTYAAHRRKNYWDNPEKFMPERFSYEETQKRPKFAWFPFGGGPRLCLGFRFAEVESVIALAMTYKKYALELLPGQGIRPEPIITLRPDRPMLFRVRARASCREAPDNLSPY